MSDIKRLKAAIYQYVLDYTAYNHGLEMPLRVLSARFTGELRKIDPDPGSRVINVAMQDDRLKRSMNANGGTQITLRSEEEMEARRAVAEEKDPSGPWPGFVPKTDSD